MNFQNDRYTLKFADSSDNAGIREIFESSAFSGGISVQYLRNPSPYESFQADGDEARILVVSDNERKRAAAVGGAVVRREYVNGQVEKCAYLTGLKIHPDYRKTLSFLTKAYDFLHEELSDCRCCYTTILDDNLPAIAMFEKKRRNMPEYRYLGHYTTYCFHGGRELLDIEKDRTEGFDQLMETHFAAQSLVPVDRHYGGFGEQTFYCARERGEIIACCFVGNQQGNKQYKMNSYGGIYKALSKLPTRLFGYPEFPKADTIVNHGVISYLYIRDHDETLCRRFLRTVAAQAGFSLLIWGGFENNPLCAALDRMRTIHYGSRLYSVLWEEGPALSGVIGMEVALL